MLGDKLREAREQQNLTYKDIEKGTSIRALYIEYIENGNYDELPGTCTRKALSAAMRTSSSSTQMSSYRNLSPSAAGSRTVRYAFCAADAGPRSSGPSDSSGDTAGRETGGSGAKSRCSKGSGRVCPQSGTAGTEGCPKGKAA